MTKPKKDVKFNHRERRMSKSSMSDFNYDSPNDERSPTRSNGAKSPTRNGTVHKEKAIKEEGRPNFDRTDTTASGWATENEDEKVGQANIRSLDMPCAGHSTDTM